METSNALSARSLQYYVLAEHWASDLEFFKIETAFFDKLINDYSIRIADVADLEKLYQLLKKIRGLKENEQATGEMLAGQLKQLALMAEDVIPENVDDVQGKQVQLEYMVTNLTREYREVKKELFVTIEHMIKDSQLLSE